ncbi:hypothetical protein [Marinibactrum halimedae]|uniref:Uncharacterized protein n=1 Tax=Marinibactrum halimedae TaxID=1444977 RepID=A0AA37T2L1_9GAMM|nr:hypothetical protein [Marinibactrum halimedae]MCD9459352.1 hypothetical protein [Marinibactrum halimedae]GLS25754.1 hypothetical protein GCM10007877_14680 [Marinibactrum halimedae]
MSEQKTTTEAVSEAPAAGAQPQGPEVNVPRLLDLGLGVIARTVMRSPKDKSKELFRRLKSGEKVQLGEITIQEKLKLKLNMSLDHKMFKGPGFNNDVFRASVDQLLKKVAPRLKARQDLNIRTNRTGGILFDLPAGVRVKGQVNVMLIIMQLGTSGEVTMQLTYFDPDQFQVKE